VRQTIDRRHFLVGMGAVSSLLVTKAVFAAASPHLVYSTSSTLSNPRQLNGATVEGQIWIFAGDLTKKQERAVFKLDGVIQLEKSRAPFAWAWDTNRAAHGSYNIQETVRYTDGTRQKLSGDIKVGVVQDEPVPPSPTPTPDGTYDRRLSGFLAGGFTVPAGQNWKVDGLVQTDANAVVHGTLTMRPGDTLRFVGINDHNFVGGGMDPLDSDVGLWVMGAGVLDAQGTPKTAWTRTPSTATGWKTGDELWITPTAPGDLTCRPFKMGDNVPRAYANVPAAEVFNTARDVSIEGTSSGRSHVFIRSTSKQIIDHVQLNHMGPSDEDGDGVLGRWALHMHHCHDSQKGKTFKGIVTKNGQARAIVAHMANGITFEECISFRNQQSPFWWDDGDESHNCSFVRCLSAEVAPGGTTEIHTNTAFMAQKGDGNAFIECIAVGTQGGGDPSGFMWPGKAKSAWEFRDCVAHNNKGNGVYWWQNNITDPAHVINGFVAYNNTNRAFLHGAYGNPVRWMDLVAMGNHVEFHAAGKASDPGADGKRTIHGLERGTVDVAGQSPHAFVASGSNTPASVPTEIFDVKFAGATKSAIFFDMNAGQQRMFDFVGCTVDGRELQSGDLEISHEKGTPDVLIRVQRSDGTAFKMAGNRTVTNIQSFA